MCVCACVCVCACTHACVRASVCVCVVCVCVCVLSVSVCVCCVCADETLLQEDIMELMPAVEQANSISEDLDKKMKFELMVVSPEARGELKGRTEVNLVPFSSPDKGSSGFSFLVGY